MCACSGRDLVDQGYFFINVLSSIIFFVALTIALFYCGALGWCIKKAAWFAHAVFGISGGEAVVAVASPFIGQVRTAEIDLRRA